MTPSERKYLEALQKQMRELERTRRPGRMALLLGGVLGVAVLSGSVPSGGLTALEQRLEVLNSKVAGLERALSDASQARAGGKVVLPFEVVNRRGETVVKIDANTDGGGVITLSNRAGPVIWISAVNAGGFVKTNGPAKFPEVVMGTTGTTGAFLIRDAENSPRVAIAQSGGKPSVELSNDNHTVVASLGQGSTGGGHLELGNAAGDAMVRAGITSGGCGRVETYPEQPVRATALGVPGDKILGNCK